MTAQTRVFMGSSGEGDARGLLRAIRKRLDQEADKNVFFEEWTWAFGLGETTIEGLEKAVEVNDFAVLVMTPDDRTASRGKSASTPRDNVVFELGLFMGAFGRERCFILDEKTPKLKLPSDLLAITTGTFEWPDTKDADEIAVALALKDPCRKIAQRIKDLGPRPKLARDSRAQHVAIHAYCESLKGAWWERITREDVNALSYFTIELDAIYNTVSLSGKSYDKNGKYVARWSSVLARPDRDKNSLLYYWSGWPTDPKLATKGFSGFGEMAFDKPQSGGAVSSGSGKFWNVDESEPENTIVKPFDLRRITDEKIITKMTAGGDESKRAQIVDTLGKWKNG